MGLYDLKNSGYNQRAIITLNISIIIIYSIYRHKNSVYRIYKNS